MKRAHKQTEVGTIPEDWTVASYSDLFEFRNGVNAGKDAYGGGTPFINVLEIITKSHLRRGDIPGRVALSSQQVDSFLVRRGDVVFNRTSETQEEVGLSSVYLDDMPVVFGGFVIRARPVNDQLNAEYCGYGLRAPVVRSQIIAMGQGAIRANVGQSDLSRVRVPLPPLPEQRAIAAALSDVDTLITGLEQLIAKKRDIKEATMQQLLTGQQRLPGFHAEWEQKRLGDCATFRTGPFGSMLHKSDYTEDGIPIVNPMHIVNGRLVPTRTMTITESAARALGDFRLRVGDIIIGRRGDMGRCAVVVPNEEGWLCGTGSMIIRPVQRVCPDFLQLQLSSPKAIQALEDTSVGSTMINLNQGVLAALIFEWPDETEQTAIAAVLSDMDAEIIALEKRLEKTRALKQGMMQELLTGRTRLV